MLPAVVPATVWAPPAHATGPGWANWVRVTARSSFLPRDGRWREIDPATAAPDPATDAAPDMAAENGVAVAAVPFWAALTQPAFPPRATALPLAGLAGGVAEPDSPPASDDAAVGLPPPADVVFADLTRTARPAAPGCIAMIAARALRGGGILTVLTRCHHHPDEPLVDLTGAVVASAQNADLLYLQHIIIPITPLRPPSIAAAAGPGRDDPVGHAVAHADLLVFARPHPPGPSTAPDAHPRPSAGPGVAPAEVAR